MKYDELISNSNYYLHHIASARGYVSRKKEPIVESYNGRFGRGYKVYRPRWDSSQYIYVDYYIEKR